MAHNPPIYLGPMSIGFVFDFIDVLPFVDFSTRSPCWQHIGAHQFLISRLPSCSIIFNILPNMLYDCQNGGLIRGGCYRDSLVSPLFERKKSIFFQCRFQKSPLPDALCVYELDLFAFFSTQTSIYSLSSTSQSYYIYAKLYDPCFWREEITLKCFFLMLLSDFERISHLINCPSLPHTLESYPRLAFFLIILYDEYIVSLSCFSLRITLA